MDENAFRYLVGSFFACDQGKRILAHLKEHDYSLPSEFIEACMAEARARWETGMLRSRAVT